MDWRRRLEQVNAAIGDHLRKFEGMIRTRVLLRLSAAEGSRWSLSDDLVLCEVGWGGVPLLVAWLHKVDPFDDVGAAWLMCHEAEADATHYQETFPGYFIEERDLAWAVLLDYSIGTRACEFVIRETIRWSALTGPSIVRPAGFAVRDAAGLWVRNVVHVPALERRYWGRQSSEQVFARIEKQIARVRDAFSLPVSLDGAGEGVPPRAVGAPFPAALRKAAAVCRREKATPQERLAAWQLVRAYIDRHEGR